MQMKTYGLHAYFPLRFFIKKKILPARSAGKKDTTGERYLPAFLSGAFFRVG